jgi:hypothetical protein
VALFKNWAPFHAAALSSNCLKASYQVCLAESLTSFSSNLLGCKLTFSTIGE